MNSYAKLQYLSQAEKKKKNPQVTLIKFWEHRASNSSPQTSFLAGHLWLPEKTERGMEGVGQEARDK